MAILVGSARSDENGKLVNGKAGDQTGREVSTQEFYIHSKGWYVIRPKDIDFAENLADKMLQACKNDNIGYDQNNRLGIMTYGINTKTKTECDCSSLVRRCIVETMGKDPGNFTTANEVSALQKTGLFEKEFVYVNQSKTPVYNGDVLVTKTKGHTVIVVSGNSRKPMQTPKTNNNINYYPIYKGSSKSLVEALANVGEKDTSYNHRKIIASKNGILNYTGTANQNLDMIKKLKEGKLIKA